MPYYCENCDEFFKYNLVKGKPPICPICRNEFFRYYRDKKITLAWAPIKARCIHCTFLNKNVCPEDWEQNDPFYHKPCEKFTPKAGARYRV